LIQHQDYVFIINPPHLLRILFSFLPIIMPPDRIPVALQQ